MFRTFLTSTLVAALFLAASAATAASLNLGAIAPGNAAVSSLVTTSPGAAFGTDDFQFTITGPGSFAVSANVSNVFPYQGFGGFAFPSFSAQLTSPSLPAPVSFTPSFDAQVLSLVPPANLGAGSYSILVNGLSGVLGAGYIVSVAVAVPEPPAAILLLAGLAAVMVRVRRRQRRAA